MVHEHQHDHSHDHHQHFSAATLKSFGIAVFLNLGFVIIEVIYAIFAHSMSLLADAGHNFGDVLGLLFTWFSTWLLTQESHERYSYGHRKTTILAAVANALLLVATSVLIGYESIRKIYLPVNVDEMVVIGIAFIGILVNGGTALLFLRGREDDLNIKAAFLHLAYDALIAFGVVVTGILIYFTKLDWLDPVAGLLIVMIILMGTWGLLRDSVNMILDAVPHYIDFQGVKNYLDKIPGVRSVHDLHVWGLSTRESAITAHLVIPERRLSDNDFQKINEDLKHQFKIDHVTLQIETGDAKEACGQVENC